MFRRLRHWLRPRTRWRHFSGLVSTIGLSAWIEYRLDPLLNRQRGPWFILHPRQSIHPLHIRRNSSDLAVFSQIFVEREYACLDDLTEVGLVIDCGANVGYSTAYFLSRYPGCHVIAIEPDPGNFSMLQRNLAPYGSRAELIRAGVWSRPAGLVIADSPYRDGREWTRQVRECNPDEDADVEGLDIASIMTRSGHVRASIIKIDVEGAEVVIFSDNYESWLNLTDAIVIELHDDSVFGKGSEVFFSAIQGQDFQISRSGELTICQRPRRTSAAGQRQR